MDKTVEISKDNTLIIAYFYLLLSSFTWALGTIIVKMYIADIPVFHLLVGRFVFGGLIVFLMAPKKVKTIEKKDLKLGTILGLLIFTTYALNVLGLKYTSASKSGFLTALSVLFIPIMQTIIYKKIPSKWTITTVILSVIGLRLISEINGGSFNLGDFITILCALSYTFYMLILEKFGKDMDDHKLSLIQLGFVAMVSLIFAAILEGLDLKLIWEGIIPIIVMGVFGTGMTMFLQTKAMKTATPEAAGVILLGEPLFTLILAYIILNEVILFKGLIGSLIILSSLIIAVVKKI